VDFQGMNELAKTTGVAVLGVFCNQFGHQTNENDADILNTLKHVRPGGGFEFAGDLFKKVNVNGAQAHPLFKEIRNTIKIPQDPPGDRKGNGCDDNDALILPRGGFDTTTVATWSPVTRNDIAWNFEKFLFDKEGNLVKRYSRYYPTLDIKKDIDALL
jgi:glutathione peroxidase